MSPEELSEARQYVSNLEAENEALRAWVAELEAGPTRHRLRRNMSAEESTSSLPAELQGLNPLSKSIAGKDALAERSRAVAEDPDDEAARRALALFLRAAKAVANRREKVAHVVELVSRRAPERQQHVGGQTVTADPNLCCERRCARGSDGDGDTLILRQQGTPDGPIGHLWRRPEAV